MSMLSLVALITVKFKTALMSVMTVMSLMSIIDLMMVMYMMSMMDLMTKKFVAVSILILMIALKNLKAIIFAISLIQARDNSNKKQYLKQQQPKQAENNQHQRITV
jgi:hypothetical protein